MRVAFAFLWLTGLLCFPVSAQTWGTVEGRVIEYDTREPLHLVTVVVDGTNYGTATSPDGRFLIRLPLGRHVLRFSAVGFVSRLDSIVVGRVGSTVVNVALRTGVIDMDDVTVDASRSPREAGVYTLTGTEIQNIPGPFRDGFRALKVLPGVATNNELSNEYSVRGGGFNENLVFLNGFEVYKPLRARQGEQEGLGLVNPDLTEQLTFYAGGFPARYGGKLSSALDVRYRRPDGQPFSGTASLSLFDASIAAGSSLLDGRLGWTVGFRRARAGSLFGTQELKGAYEPDFADVQGTLSYRIAQGHEIEAIGIWADHTFRLDPRGRKTYFGMVSLDPNTPSNLQSVWINYDGEEHDGYGMRFGGLRMRNRLSESLRAEHDVAYFGIDEYEFVDVQGAAVLFQVDTDGNPTTGAGHLPMGSARQHDFADNRVTTGMWTGQGRYVLFGGTRSVSEAGWMARSLYFTDRLDEKSAVSGRNIQGEAVRIVVDSLGDSATMNALQGALYAQHSVDLLPERDRLTVTGGVRADFYSFNEEWTLSPRLSARFVVNPLLTVTAAWGLYHQAPLYRELRGQPEVGTSVLGPLNVEARSQRAIQYVAGAEYFLPRRRFYARAEAYLKQLSNLISYDIQNVRVRYSGNNDSRGHAYGLDMQLRGEFVPGLESWINYSYLVSQESFLPPFATPEKSGMVARPADQRHTFSAFVQDYIPGDETWKLHMRALFGSGLPYTPPQPGPTIGGVTIQLPGERNSRRFTEYMRMDMGITKEIKVFERGPAAGARLDVTGEVLNVFNMTNTVAYSWIPADDGRWRRIPTRLTPRTINVRMRLSF
jgi:hypothetical protein